MSVLFLREPLEFKIVEQAEQKKARKYKSSMSNGEKFITKILKDLGFEYTREYSIPSLPKLRYDFCLKNHKVLIEYDSDLHMKFSKYIHKTENKFKRAQQRDILKTSEAIQNGYLIIRVDYTYLDKDISDLLKSQIDTWDNTQSKGKCITLTPSLYKYLENEINPKIISKYKKRCI
jgi:very-short-patch-repair endonuclease